MPVLRFVQISDLHLGAPFAWLPPERRAERRREQQRALEAAVGLAIDRAATAILVPGDLFDAEGVDAETLAFAVHAFTRPGCPRVFIAPGNHDPYTTTSLYWNPRLLGARGWSWPEHVHVFREPGWAPFPLPDVPVTVWGRSYASSTPTFERPLEARALAAVDTADGRLAIAAFHGSREGACPPGQVITAPFTDGEAHAAPFAYMAVGHYHQPSRLGLPDSPAAADAAPVRLAYAGSPIALGIVETGTHGGLEVRLDTETRRASVEAIALDPRSMHTVTVDLTGASSAGDADRRVLAELDSAGVGEQDIARVRLVGRIVRGVRYPGPGPEVLARVFALRVDLAAVRPDYDLEGIRVREPATTEDRFAHALLAELDAEHDPERRARVLSALYYGLDAFRLREVVPAYEELSAAREESET